MITLTPLSASASSSTSSEPVCYLLELDDARIFLDLGQRDYRSNASRSTWEYEEKIRELAPTLSLVLLSHSSSAYLGLYPFARARWGLTCPVYATQPTVEMGRVVCLAEAESWRFEVEVKQDQNRKIAGANAGEDVATGALVTRDKGKEPLRGPFVPTIEEIHEAFDWIKPVRYNQPLHLGGELSDLLLTPFPSGHTLGGSLFKIRSPTSGTILYALGINHTSERHLDGIMGSQGAGQGYDEGLIRPDLLIAEAGRAEVVNVKRKDRETAILDVITSTLESSHSVLMPTDPSPRLLELLVLLDQHWTFKQTQDKQKRRGEEVWSYPLCVVSKTVQDMLAFARSLIEWMGGVVRDSGPSGDEVIERRKRGRGRRRGGEIGSEYGALDFRNIQFFASPTDLLQAHSLNRPKVILAVPPSMSHGPSRWLFTAMASNEGNVILLTSFCEEDTLARDLYDKWDEAQTDTAKWGKGRNGIPVSPRDKLQLEINSKVPLMGSELEDHLEKERAVKEREAAAKAAADRSRRMLEADDLDSDSDSDSEGTPDDGIIIARRTDANAYAGDTDNTQQMSFDIYVKGQQTRIKSTEGGMTRFRMFPFVQRMGRKVDDYGEGLDIGQWIRKGREIEEEGETEEVREAKKRKVEEEERQKAPPEPPSKFVTEDVNVDFKASIMYVDMDGLHDGQAIKTIISDLQPRKVILVRSSDSATRALAAFLSNIFQTKDLYTPSTSETIKIGEHVQSYSLVLGNSITSGLSSKWSKFEGYEVMMIDGKIALSAGSTVPTLEFSNVTLEPVQHQVVAEEKEETADIMVKQEPELHETPPPSSAELTIPTPSAKSARLLPGSLFVGDIRLSALKSRLNELGIPAEFAGEGILICGPGVAQRTSDPDADVKPGSIIAVKKTMEGELTLEGSVGKVYFDVRKEVYGSLALVEAAA